MSAAVESVVSTVKDAAQATVETITEAVKNTSLDTKTSETDAAHAEGRRLYIGNLAYSTTDDKLEEFFQGFSIESTSIPTHPRTGRAVGYAFVDLTTKEEAERAIQELSGKEVLERKVSVQHARKPGTAAPKKEGEEHAEGAESEGKKGPRPARGRGKGRGRGGKKGVAGEKSGDEGQDEKPINVPGQVLPLVDTTNIKTEATEKAADAHKGAFKPKKKGPPEDGVPSKTKIMVANLPYELGEDKLEELFAAYEPESAKIALRPIPRYMVRKLQARGEPRKGRGFGFVTLASEEMQLKAVAEMNGKEIEGREIAVKVAIDSQNHETDSSEKENAEVKTEVKTEEKSAESNGIKVEATD